MEETLTLRPVCPNDLALIAAWRRDNEDDFFGWRRVVAHSQEAWLAKLESNPSKVAFMFVQNEGKPDEEAIGFCQVVDIDHRNKTAEIGGFMIREAIRGKGYGKEMVEALVHFCFYNIGLRKLCLRVFDDNAVARSVYVATGFECEGVLARHVWKNGRWRDVVLMARFRDAKHSDSES